MTAHSKDDGMREALEPCPFCGGTNTQIDERRLSPTMHGPGAIISATVQHWCPVPAGQPTGLNVSMHGRDRESAIAAWNARALLSSSAAASGVVVALSDWQPIETAPQGEDVLIAVFRDDFEDPIIQNSILIDGEDKGLYWSDWHGMPEPTHWMRYPALSSSRSAGGSEVATRAEDGPTAPISTDTKGTTSD